MKCEEFEVRLNQILDVRREPEADRELMEHAVTCQACGRRSAALLKALTVLSARPLPLPSARLLDRVLAEVRPPVVRPSGKKWTRSSRPLTFVAAAAVLAAAAWLVGNWSRQHFAARVSGQRQQTPLAGQQPSPVGEPHQTRLTNRDHEHLPAQRQRRRAGPNSGQRPAENVPPLPKLALDATDTYRDLAEETRASLAAALLALPRLTPAAGEPLEPSQQPTLLVQAGAAATGWMKPVAAPIGRSTSQALRSLMVVVPSALPEPIP